jgi:ElaB/YqjD/DUF883 family membrane-anchored ribosome-binding protein
MKPNGTAVAELANNRISDTASRAVRAGEDSLELLREDLTAIRGDVSKLMKHGRDEIAHRASDVAKSASDSARAVADRATEARDALTSFAGERPFTTIAIAAVGGMLLAGMCSRSLRR